MTERSFDPSEEEVFEDLMENERLKIHVAMPGRIQSYDPVHQVADIVIGLDHTYPDPEGSGEYLHERYPVLPAVPILWPRMGRWFLAMSVERGDAVQLLFNSSAIGMWRRSTAVDNVQGIQRALQGISRVGDVGRHHLQHAVALLGLETYGRALRHAPPLVRNESDEAGCLRFGSDLDDGMRVSIYGDGSLKITKGAATVFNIDIDGKCHLAAEIGEALALAAKTNAIVSSLKALIHGWTPTGTGDGASLKALIETWSPDDTDASKVFGV